MTAGPAGGIKQNQRVCQYFSHGTWTIGPDIVANTGTDTDSYDDILKTCGFSEYDSFGGGDFDISIRVLVRPSAEWPWGDESPHYLFELVAGASSTVEFIYVDDVGSVWELLAKFLPVIRDAQIIETLRQATVAGDTVANKHDGTVLEGAARLAARARR